MTPAEFVRQVIEPGAAWLAAVTGHASIVEAKRMLLAIAIQESAITHRAQVLTGGAAGPARGFWQFEQGGGVAGVLRHPASRPRALACCEATSVIAEAAPVWRTLEGHDLLAYAFARLLLLTDPYAVPVTQDAAWGCYADRLWRPGKPHKVTWAVNWAKAIAEYPL
jgi:hypothetical protein